MSFSEIFHLFIQMSSFLSCVITENTIFFLRIKICYICEHGNTNIFDTYIGMYVSLISTYFWYITNCTQNCYKLNIKIENGNTNISLRWWFIYSNIRFLDHLVIFFSYLSIVILLHMMKVPIYILPNMIAVFPLYIHANTYLCFLIKCILFLWLLRIRFSLVGNLLPSFEAYLYELLSYILSELSIFLLFLYLTSLWNLDINTLPYLSSIFKYFPIS